MKTGQREPQARAYRFSQQQIFLFLILVLTVIAYLPLWHNAFVSWDDEVYITGNELIQSFSLQHLYQIFTTSFEGHYHPLSLLSLMADYLLAGPVAQVFHLHNLALHLFNSVLVYLFISRLTKQPLVGGISGLLFALHPMHVEAVAWATARKDVLYTAYFLLSMLYYLHYLDKAQKKWYWLALGAGLLSMLSKGQGVFLPLCLVLIDYYRQGSLFRQDIWKNKFLFFAAALLLGVLAYLAQRETGYMGESPGPGGLLFLLTPLGSFCLYLVKLFLPIYLSAYYPIPDLTTLPYALFAAGGAVAISMLVLIAARAYRDQRAIFFGLLFFTVNLFVFLRFIPVSNYLIADRYTYISSIGLFFLAGEATRWLAVKWGRPGMVLLIALIPMLVLAALSRERVKVWESSLSLTDDILRQYPDVYPALNIRGKERLVAGDTTGALADFNRALAIQPQHSRAWANRAGLYLASGKTNLALNDLNKALSLEPGQYRLLNNRGLVYYKTANLAAAIRDFDQAIKRSPDFAEAYNNRGMVKAEAGRADEACADFSKAVSLSPSFASAWANRGKCRNKLGDPGAAVIDLEESLRLGLKTPRQYFELGFSWYLLKDFYKAREYFDQCLALSPGDPGALAYRGYACYNAGDFFSAVDDLTLALRSDSLNALAWGLRGLALMRINKKEEGCSDLEKALSLGLQQAQKEIEKYCR